MKEKIELPTTLTEHIPWENSTNPIWPASTFILRRNLSRYNFPPKMQERQLEQTQEILKTAFSNLKNLKDVKVLPAEQLLPIDKEFLFEHFLELESFENTMQGQAFLVDGNGQFLGLINIEDHLQLHRIDCKDEWEIAWNSLSQTETEISQAVDYAFSSKFGYLTSDPSLCGTGLKILVYLHLPALIHTQQLDALLKQKEEEVEATSMLGTMDELMGDFVILRNSFSLGLSEENILHSLHSSAMKLVIAEQALRLQLKKEDSPLIKDQVSRAFGLLTLSYQLHAKEALNALSLLKLGIDLGWISGITDQKITEIFFKCRRAHLVYALKIQSLDLQDIARKRAEYLHSALKGTTLHGI